MSVDNFIPQIWSARLIENLHNNLVYAQTGMVNRDYEGEIQEAGNTVRINSIGTVQVNDYIKNTDMASPQVLTDAQETLVIDQAKSFNFQIDDVDNAQTRPKLMNAAMNEAAYALRNVTDQYVRDQMLADVLASNKLDGGTARTIGADSTTMSAAYDSLVDLGVVLDDNNVPEDSRWVIVPNWYEGVLLKDPRFVSFGTPQNRMNLEQGSRAIGQVSGFNVFKSNNVKNVTGDDWAVIAGHSMATTFADQINKVVAYSPEKRFADAVKGLHLYGAKVVRPYALAYLLASKS
jgi:hypothetical protein